MRGGGDLEAHKRGAEAKRGLWVRLCEWDSFRRPALWGHSVNIDTERGKSAPYVYVQAPESVVVGVGKMLVF